MVGIIVLNAPGRRNVRLEVSPDAIHWFRGRKRFAYVGLGRTGDRHASALRPSLARFSLARIPAMAPDTPPAMRVGVVGHVDWIDFVAVEHVPEPGEIVTADESWGEAAGGGGVAAV